MPILPRMRWLRANTYSSRSHSRLTRTQLQQVVSAFVSDNQILMVGFNRRYAPLAVALRDSLASRAQPMSIVYRANVGYRPPNHWLHHPREGGGVIVGEACHHIDFCCWLVGAPVVSVDVRCLGGTGAGYLREDNVHVTLGFADGSLATLLYLSNGAKAFPTETIEVSCENRSARLVDFRELETGAGCVCAHSASGAARRRVSTRRSTVSSNGQTSSRFRSGELRRLVPIDHRNRSPAARATRRLGDTLLNDHRMRSWPKARNRSMNADRHDPLEDQPASRLALRSKTVMTVCGIGLLAGMIVWVGPSHSGIACGALTRRISSGRWWRLSAELPSARSIPI